MDRPSVVRSNRKVLTQAQSWLQPSGGSRTSRPAQTARSAVQTRSKTNTTAAYKPELAEQIVHDRLAARQIQGLERAKEQGQRRRNLALEKQGILPKPSLSDAPQKSTRSKPSVPRVRRKSAAGRTDEDASLEFAMAMQREEWQQTEAKPSSCTNAEQVRREALLGMVDERLAQSDMPERAYVKELQRMEDEEASRALIAQLAIEDHEHAQQMARAQQRRQRAAAQREQEQYEQQAMRARMSNRPAPDQIDMSYEHLVQLSPVEVGLSADALGALPRCTVHELGDPGSECVICLSEWSGEAAEIIQLQACGHCFHAECISTWLRTHTKCPMCNADVEGERAVHEDI